MNAEEANRIISGGIWIQKGISNDPDSFNLWNGWDKYSFDGQKWEYHASDVRRNKEGNYSIVEAQNKLYIRGISVTNRLEGEIELCAINERYILLQKETVFCILYRNQ